MRRDDLVAQVAASDPRSALAAISELRDYLASAEAERVLDARSKGLTWDEIALLLRTTRQAVHRKYRHLEGGRQKTMLTLDKRVRRVIRESADTATQWNAPELGIEHLFVELVLDGAPGAGPVAAAVGTEQLRERVLGKKPARQSARRKPANSDEVLHVLRDSIEVAKASHARSISPGHVLAATLGVISPLTEQLTEMGVDIPKVRRAVLADC